MRTALLRWLTAAVACLDTGVGCFAQAVKPPEGFVALFDGQSLDGWHGRSREAADPRTWKGTAAECRQQWNDELGDHWKVIEGVLVNDGQGADLTTNQEFGDMELRIDYQAAPLAESGICWRGAPPGQLGADAQRAQLALGLDHGSDGFWSHQDSGPGQPRAGLADQPWGQWRTLRIRQVGARTSLWLDGRLVVDHAILENSFDPSLPLSAQGVIQLQPRGRELRWRNIFVRPLQAEEANRILAEKSGGAEFKRLFDGKSLAGWAGATNNYEVVDGALRCKAGQGGVLRTADMYKDFVARLEFKLPPGGNNGLAIRYPGEGDAAYTGMCELQVLDTEHPMYAAIDPRQAHGSAYGLAPAARGYLRATGQWNFQVVTVQGSTIKVELNGTPILDTDLSLVTEWLANRPHPGQNRTEGYFGLAGHSDPVEFRNISIKKL